ncbi:venom metalloproteinase antarease-like TtrivMP_A [Centruroides sculpturatus]|uniref:venom metalloproteinase antarease-like TtrivMP_A n=1 Tax=Centruroides sculpturatus TaxID=218467 RepID=UPI000C6E9F63|nr:venom metalloproteinase antarease-like TtrivMP_A [Centruroides sculpturatus]
MIFYFAIFFPFVVVSAISSGRVDVLVFPSVETSRSGVKTVKFRALNKEIEVKLEPAGEILAENFALLDANNRILPSIEVQDLKRKMYRNSTNGAALLIDEEGPVKIEGIVNSNLRIEPYESGRTDREGRIPHQIVKVISDKNSFGDDGVMPIGVKETVEKVERMARDDQCIVLKYLILSESNFTRYLKREEYLEKFVARMFIEVQNIIDTLELGIKLSVIGVILYKRNTDPSYIHESAIPGYERHLNAYDLLDKMSYYYCYHATGLAVDADIIMLIVNRKLGSLNKDNSVSLNVLGIAYTTGVCKRCTKVGVVTIDPLNHPDRAWVVAHESGHLLGSVHDGEDANKIGFPGNPGALDCPSSDGYIMGGRRNGNENKFSKCSKESIKYTLS